MKIGTTTRYGEAALTKQRQQWLGQLYNDDRGAPIWNGYSWRRTKREAEHDAREKLGAILEERLSLCRHPERCDGASCNEEIACNG